MTTLHTCNVFRKLSKIQTCGYFIMVLQDSFKIIGFSENVMTDVLKLTFDERCKLSNLLDILNVEYHTFFKKSINKLEEYSTKNIIMKINDNEFYFTIYKTNIYILLEFEHKQNDYIDTFKNLINVSYDINIINYNDYLLNNISKLINYDRVMIYKFNKDWSGYVVNEIINENSSSLLNHYFAETDIPQYVRGIFMKNKSRYIEDRDDLGIQIHIKGNPIFDITMSQLTIVSESHQHYLKSLNVKSAFSCSIIINNELWGLLICHNHTKKSISPLIRSYCLKLVDFYIRNVSIQKKKGKRYF